MSLRALSASHRSLASLQDAGLFSPQIGDLLRDLVHRRESILVSGGTGAGKTTLLAALLAEVPERERILLVEDTPELFPDHPHVIGLRTRDAGVDGAGEIDVRTLVRQSLRMRPDRIVVGEIRGAEIAELLLAFNTGHAGSAGTVHANGVDAVPGRLRALGALAGLPDTAVDRQVADGIGVVVHVERTSAGRRVTSIGRFVVDDADGLTVERMWDAC
ncbi:MAG: CpaF family protein [Corynebacterium variabile]